MKYLLVFFTFFISQFVLADQWYVLKYKEAVQAKTLLDKQSQVILFCGCCDNEPKILIDVEKITIEKYDSYNKNDDYYYINLNGQKPDGSLYSEGVDLAYVHILKKDGLAYNVAGELLWEVDPCIAPFEFNGDDSISEDEEVEKLNDIHEDYKSAIKSGELNSIYVNESSYPAIQALVFHQTKNSHFSTEGQFKESSFLTIGKKEDNSGLILLQKFNADFFSKETKLHLSGNLWIYLEDGSVIKCIDRKIYGYVDDTSSIIYYLTKSEIEKLIRSKMKSISYSLTERYGNEVNNYSAEYSLLNENYINELKILFE